MSAFVPGGAPRTTPASSHISTDPFWPSIDIDKIRDALRIGDAVTPARLETAVIAAAISVNRELLQWRGDKVAQGYTTLDAVPADLINGQSELVHLYARAIQAATGAEVCERYRSYDATASGDSKAEAVADNIADYRRDQRWAISDLTHTRRMTVELI